MLSILQVTVGLVESRGEERSEDLAKLRKGKISLYRCKILQHEVPCL